MARGRPPTGSCSPCRRHRTGRARPLPVADLGQVLAASLTQWFEGAIGDIQAGLDRAGRCDASSRRVRAVLAFGQPEFFSRRWFRVGWDDDRDATVELLTDSWRALLVD